MLTIFTLPKPFKDKHTSIIQENAIKSWVFLPKTEVILIGNEEGIEKKAGELGVKHIKNVKRNQFGTPLLNDAFNKARNESDKKYLCYINADIILLKDFLNIFKFVPKKDFLIVGQRWDLEVGKLIKFDANWEDRIREKLKKEGELHRPRGKAGSDYFVFKRSLFRRIPPFSVGRVGWDNWMIFHARKKGMIAIDATPLVRIIHQNHGYPETRDTGKKKRESPEGRRNILLAGSEKNLFNLGDCNYMLTKKGLRRKGVFFKPINRFFKTLFKVYLRFKF